MSPRDISYKSFEDLTDELSNFILSPLVRQITGGIHVNDALIHDAWGTLPSEWTTYWDALPDHRLAQRQLIDSIGEDDQEIVNNSSNLDKTESLPPPSSLTTWLGSLKAVSLPRIQRQGPVLTLPEALTTPMKTKKINEVSVAAAYIHQVVESNGITHIIDMGSGQGYLSVTLAHLFPSLRILAIDGSEAQVAGSKAFAASLQVPEHRLTHLVRYIDGSAPLAAEMDAWAAGQKCMLVGLHACGSLSEYMLRYFQLCPFITHLGAVGCCYNHIVPRSAQCPDGFPISERMRRRNVTLSATALMTGCQAPNNWARSDLSQASSVYSRKQFYRAVVEKLLHDKDIKISAGGTAEDRPNWGIRKGDLVTFERFTRRAMHYLDIDQSSISAEDIREYEERYQDHEGRIAILWTLSVLCCKAVESVIALDRYWFLVEKGFLGVDIVPIFDYEISPRNLMIVAERS
ncbi:hypothetical protein N0V93_005186 [Gnomoniopsis smithogilvyi]|uniref:Methyltransferase domain-containing protein n=1 Tax=Gnomoniopsis smithogilvyi TaxID=1191159 RepID=A0A9W8YSF9_9PEZI|nr:hypothetical protein N0V93_005186 [Gnomoniopsis smithogilvyi]